ncbi:MAG: amidohydrolase family protein [Desulfobacterales bacterium]
MTTVFEDQIGTIEEGKLSDLVVTSGNPLDDIDLLCNSENIDLVMLGGNLVKGPAA